MNNIDPQNLALILLILRIAATALIGAVVLKQLKNIRTLHTDYPTVRITILLLTITLLIGQIMPIILDYLVAFTDIEIGRQRDPNAISSGYAINNAVKDVIIGALLAFLHYRKSPPKRDPQTGL